MKFEEFGNKIENISITASPRISTHWWGELKIDNLEQLEEKGIKVTR